MMLPSPPGILFTTDFIWSNYASLNPDRPAGESAGSRFGKCHGEPATTVCVSGSTPEVMRIRNLTPDMAFYPGSTEQAGFLPRLCRATNCRGEQSLSIHPDRKGRLTTPEEFGNIILRTEQGGKILRLKDIARIELGSSSYNVTSRLRGQQAAAIAIYQPSAPTRWKYPKPYGQRWKR